MLENIQMSKYRSEGKRRNAAMINLEKGKYCYQMKELERAEQYLTEAEKFLESKKDNKDEKDIET